MILAEVSGVLRITGLLVGAGIGAVFVYLAMAIPPRMDREERARPTWWWGVAVLVGIGFGWFAGDSGWALFPAFVAFGATTLGLGLIDLDHQLLPDRVLFPGMGISAAALAVGALVDGAGSELLRSFLGAVVYFVVLLVVALLARGGFGMGDVKLALLLGLFLGFRGWDMLLLGFVVAILMGGVVSIVLLVFTSKGRDAKFAYGPYLILGAWIALFWGEGILDWYLGN